MEIVKKEEGQKFYGSSEDEKQSQVALANQEIKKLEDNALKSLTFGEGLTTKQVNKLALYKYGVNPFTIAKGIADGAKADKVIKKKKYVKDDDNGQPIFEEEIDFVPDHSIRHKFLKTASEMTEDQGKEHKETSAVNIFIKNDAQEIERKNPNIDFELHAQ